MQTVWLLCSLMQQWHHFSFIHIVLNYNKSHLMALQMHHVIIWYKTHKVFFKIKDKISNEIWIKWYQIKSVLTLNEISFWLSVSSDGKTNILAQLNSGETALVPSICTDPLLSPVFGFPADELLCFCGGVHQHPSISQPDQSVHLQMLPTLL